MKKLTDAEKATLKDKIATERVGQHQKEQKLIAYKQQYRKFGGSGTSGFSMVGFSKQSFSGHLRKAKREKAFNHVFNKGEPLRRMKLTAEEKEALRKKIARVE
jgi:cell division FtsZ-interacting protein ZapD